MTTRQQMTQARKEVRIALKLRGKDTSYLHRVAMESLAANGMKECIVTEMAQHAMLDVICRFRA